MLTIKRNIYSVIAGLTLLVASLQLWAAAPPPSDAQCKSKWTLTQLQPLAFGTFSIESGSATIHMDSNANLTTSGAGAITLASTDPVSTFKVTVTNTKDPAVCGTYPFELSWSVLPADLAGPGTAMPLTNVLVSEPTLIPTPTALPITGLTTASLPITLTFQGDLTATFLQAAGLYTSPAFTLDLIQSGQATSLSTTATATSLSTLTLAETVAMNFGSVAGGSSANSVIMDTSGARSVTGDAQILSSGPGTAATFQVTGESSLSYTISISGPAVLESAGGQQITATSFTHNSSGVLPLGGTDTFEVGATLNLGPLQPAGTYSTAIGGGVPYTVTVNYN